MRNTIYVSAFFVLLAGIPFFSHAATYYVDSASGDDAKAGTSQSEAWRTIKKVNGSAFSPGDKILFKGNWNEMLVIPSGGSAGNPVTYTSDRKALIEGVMKCVSSGNKSHVIIENFDCRNTLGPEEGAIKVVGGSDVTVRGNEVRNAAAGGITVRDTNDIIIKDNYVDGVKGAWAEGIQVYASTGSAPSGFKILGNTVKNIEGSAILAQDYDDGEVADNDVSFAGGYGIAVAPTRTGREIKNHEIHDNLVHDVSQTNFAGKTWSASGISVGAVRGKLHLNAKIYDNEVYNVKHPAGVDGNCIIVDAGADYAEVYGNKVHDCEGAGIQIVRAGYAQVHHNVIWNNGYGPRGSHSGITIGGYAENKDTKIYNNTLYKNRSGIRIADGGAIGTSVKNNLIANSFLYAMDFTTSTDTVSDKNLIFPDGKFRWRNKESANFDAWKASSGQDKESILTDPKFKNLESKDFSLLSSSPAKDMGAFEVPKETGGGGGSTSGGNDNSGGSSSGGGGGGGSNSSGGGGGGSSNNSKKPSEPKKIAKNTVPDTTGCVNGYAFSPLTGAKCPEGNLAPSTVTPVVLPIIFDTMTLQSILNMKLLGQIEPLKVDGKFGQKTLQAVMMFQAQNGLKADGIVGPLTRAKLNNTLE